MGMARASAGHPSGALQAPAYPGWPGFAFFSAFLAARFSSAAILPRKKLMKKHPMTITNRMVNKLSKPVGVENKMDIWKPPFTI
jgi:hypothetical protein